MLDRAHVGQGKWACGSEASGPDPADLEMDIRPRQPHREKAETRTSEHSLTRGTPSLSST